MSHRALGPQFEFVHHYDEDEGTVTAVHPDEGEVGFLNYHIEPHSFDREAIYPDNLHVDDRHRRHGLARLMFTEAMGEHALPVIHDPGQMTPEAVAAVDRIARHNPQHLRWDEAEGRSRPWGRS